MMRGLGTIVNAAAVVAAALLGMVFKGGIKQKYQNALMCVLGLATMFIGASGTLEEMLVIKDGSLSAQGALLLVISLVIGALAGEFLRVEDRLESLGEKLRKAVKAKSDSSFTEGFVSTTLVICVGAMAIVGSLKDGISGDHSTLFVKAALDFCIVTVYASAMGLGVLFSALPLAIYQGSITLLSGVVSGFMSDRLISNLNLVGSAMIFAIGVNLAFGKKFKVGNILPGLLVPVIYELILLAVARFA